VYGSQLLNHSNTQSFLWSVLHERLEGIDREPGAANLHVAFNATNEVIELVEMSGLRIGLTLCQTKCIGYM
jgi:hypothetical protein